jgi:hypothetical protein
VTVVAGLTVALRAKYGELAVLAPIALFILAILFGPDFALAPRALALALLAAILFWLIWRRWYRRRTSIRLLAAQAADAQGRPLETASDNGFVGLRTLVSAGVIMALAFGGAAFAAAASPPRNDRVVLRDAIEQPFDPRDYVSPLSTFRSYWRQPVLDDVLFSVRGLPDGQRIRIATLDTYDGIVYSVGSDLISSASGAFTRVPFRFDQSTVDGEQATLVVDIENYDLVWVPTVGKFETISFSGNDSDATRNAFYYNDTSSTAAVIGGLVQGDSYTLNAVLPVQPTDAELSTLDSGAARVPTVTVLPEQLGVALDGYVSGVEGQGNRLVAMLNGLATDGYISHGVDAAEPPSRSGHAVDRIDQLLTDAQMIGDGEQYAVTAALMATELGFPARVVFGFAPDASSATTGSVEVRGSDVAAWIEVNTAQFGWVTIDPTPAVRDIPEQTPEEPAQVARPQTVVPPPLTETESVDRQNTPDSQQDEPQVLDPFLVILLDVLRVLAWVVLGVAIIASPFIVILGAKLRRRRLRRKALSPVDQITGGWSEFQDAVADHGFVTPASATRSEVAGVVGGMSSRILASVADRAVFSPDTPDEVEVESVWRAVDDLRAGMDEDKSWWERLKASVSLRSLGGYSVTRLFKR